MDLLTLKSQRARTKGALTRIETYCNNINSQISKEALQIRLDKLEELQKEFMNIQDQMYQHVDDSAYVDPESEIESFENKYFSVKEILLKAINERQSPTSSPENGNLDKLVQQQVSFLEHLSHANSSPNMNQEILSNSETKLPKIQIPIFTGNYTEWVSFHDLFIAAVHSNTKLSNSQKFHYLKSFVQDEAASLLRHITISESNYTQAWERLNQRYDKKGQIVKSFVKTFLSLPSLSSASASGLRKLCDNSDEVIRGLKALGPKAEGRDPWLIYLLLNKLDLATRQDWAEQMTSEEFPTFDQLINFLDKKCQALEDVQPTRNTVSHSKFSKPAHTSLKNLHLTSCNKCPKCQNDHNLFHCKEFHAMDTSTRRKFVNDNHLCFNCLRLGHNSSNCNSKGSCQQCNRRHHTLVHQNFNSNHKLLPNNQSSSSSTSIANSSSSNTSQTNDQPIIKSHVAPVESTQLDSLLPTVVANVCDSHGNLHSCRILLDSGSQVSFISESCLRRLKISRQNARIAISGLSSVRAGTTKGVVDLTICSRINSQQICINAFVLQTLTSQLPSCKFNLKNTSQLSSIELADPHFNLPSAIDILLGADKMFHILENDQIKIKNTPLIAQSTMFGWIIAGMLPQGITMTKKIKCTHTSIQSEFDIDQSLQKFWEIEHVDSKITMTEEENEAEEHYLSTTKRDDNGRYIVELPFKKQHVPLGESYETAFKRLISMEQRFQKNIALFESYKHFIHEYLILNHMEKIPQDDIKSESSYYLPHHAVLKPSSSTTKLRVVFDGSCKSSTGNSLNDALLIGPTIQKELFSICLRFRRYRYVFTADIEKMYRQIWIANKHCNYQRILWRESPEHPIEHYRLKTVTYGTSSAPFLAIRTIQQLAKDYASVYPNAVKALLSDCYVDDIITGAHSVNELLTLKHDLTSLLNSAGFKLRKWSSNCWPLLNDCPQNDCELSNIEFENDSKDIKTLGMNWYPSGDSFCFRSYLSPTSTHPTKRKLLSEASRIFDPLGLITPVTVAIKILFQELWLLKVTWDDPIPSIIAERWNRVRNELQLISQLRIPRWLLNTSNTFELHGFSDASEKAYAAVIYCRTLNSNNSFDIQLVAAKSKVSPLKQITLPRLELCAALLLTRLMKRIFSSLELKSSTMYFWTDSEIVLNWLSSNPRKWKTFVANRTSEILDFTSRSNWRHVSSHDNPADPASRGLFPSELIINDLWLQGPMWLKEHYSKWPSQQSTVITNPDLLETRTITVQSLISKETDALYSILFTRISTWTRLLRTLAFCIRFCHNVLKKSGKLSGCLNTGSIKCKEIQLAQNLCIKSIQYAAFYTEIANLKRGRCLTSKSKLISLTPFLDAEGLLRVGGRLSNADIPYRTKHPIILPKGHTVSQLIIKHYHIKYLHIGLSSLTSLLRQDYWILGARNMIRKMIHECIPCFRQKQATTYQLMSNLPTPRVNISRPFSHVGCDYAGPLTLRLSRGRNPKFIKGYISLFICLSTKAIHLELVSDLTSDAFIAALRRFIARRGKCTNLYSDNGTNFKGAVRKLSELHTLLTSETHNKIIQDFLSQDNISWTFNPPATPHFGGLWEAGVKSVKTHLKRVIGNNILTFEEMYTTLTQIEAVLNSRPLCSLSDNEFEVLTPFHLITGHSYSSISEPNLTNQPVNRLSNWELLQNLLQGFWKRWQAEYLTILQQRPKWHNIQPDINKGDLVILKEPNLPPAKWLLARVVDGHPGKDGLTRVYTVRTQHGDLMRPIVKLVRLPISS